MGTVLEAPGEKVGQSVCMRIKGKDLGLTGSKQVSKIQQWQEPTQCSKYASPELFYPAGLGIFCSEINSS